MEVASWPATAGPDAAADAVHEDHHAEDLAEVALAEALDYGQLDHGEAAAEAKAEDHREGRQACGIGYQPRPIRADVEQEQAAGE